MNGKDLFNAVGNIDDKYISEFADTSQFKKKKTFLLSPKFYSGLAAAFVLGIAILIAVQTKSQQITTAPKNNTAVSRTAQADSTAPSITNENKSAEKDNTDINNNAGDYNNLPAPTDNFISDSRTTADDVKSVAENSHFYAEEPHYDDTKNENMEVAFTVKVFSAEQPELLSQNSTLQIKGDFNPLMSSSEGIGIEFEVTPYKSLTITAESGHFVTWDSDSGVITNHGSVFDISETTDFFWTFDGKTENTSIKISDSNSLLSTIAISYDESTNTFYAKSIYQT